MYTRGVPGSVHESVLDAIGATPLIRLRRVVEGLAPTIYVKAEWQNAGGSVKDRAALWMVRAAERSGALGPGGVIVEGTSGNTGIGLALVGGSSATARSSSSPTPPRARRSPRCAPTAPRWC